MLTTIKAPAPALRSAPGPNTQEDNLNAIKMNWLGFMERPKQEMPQQQQMPKMMPRQESTDSQEGVQLGERKGSITLADIPQASMQRRESDIERLYRLSNQIHGFGGSD